MKKAIALRRLSPLSSCTKSPRYFLLRGRIEEGERSLQEKVPVAPNCR